MPTRHAEATWSGDLKGAWAWLNFHNEPWEANGSPYFGASLAALAVGRAPGGYASSPEIATQVGGISPRNVPSCRPDDIRVNAVASSGPVPTKSHGANGRSSSSLRRPSGRSAPMPKAASSATPTPTTVEIRVGSQLFTTA